MLAGLLVLVLLLMQQAHRAENYHWLWHLQGQAIPADQEADWDTRVRDREAASGLNSEFGPLVMGVRSDAQQPSEAPSPGSASSGEPSALKSPLDQARTDAWSGLMHSLEDDLRRRFVSGLKSSRDGQVLDEQAGQGWLELVVRLDDGWRRYLNEARRSLDEVELKLTGDERLEWLDVLTRLEQQWQQQSLPALSMLAAPTGLPVEHQAAIADIQADLDRVFLSTIRDNTVFRSAESDAWFRLFERLSRNDATELQTDSAPVVSFGQLFKQPEVYRGRLVTVQGTARRAEFMEAPENLYGIDSYFRLWLQPVGSNSPIVIYSLDVPDGFPALKIARTPDAYLDLDEEVRITGFFFKRWPYSAQDGTRLAPVLLSRTFSWTPSASALAEPGNLPHPAFWIAVVSGTAGVGVVIAVSVYWFSGRSTPLALRRRLTSASKKGTAP
jgi:hypothetical protein